jgi:hypothetical protein
LILVGIFDACAARLKVFRKCNFLVKQHSSLTIWKADKTIFKIVCKVLNVYRKINTKKHIQVFLGISLLQ